MEYVIIVFYCDNNSYDQAQEHIGCCWACQTHQVCGNIRRARFVFAYSYPYLELTSDDKLIIRNCIKNGDDQLAERVHKCKKDKNYQNLQIYLRKFVKDLKENDKYGMGILKPNQRGKTPLTLKSAKNQT